MAFWRDGREVFFRRLDFSMITNAFLIFRTSVLLILCVTVIVGDTFCHSFCTPPCFLFFEKTPLSQVQGRNACASCENARWSSTTNSPLGDAALSGVTLDTDPTLIMIVHFYCIARSFAVYFRRKSVEVTLFSTAGRSTVTMTANDTAQVGKHT